jgi:uncharacterized membrane protein YgdD (TMEM256/DUF423 family)
MRPESRTLIFLAGILGFLGVAAGAFGTHALKDRLSPEMLAIFETGVRYHLIHVLALLGAAWVADRIPNNRPVWAGRLFMIGILVFSGSLYILALTGVRWLGAVTPLGGVCLLMGWILLALAPRGGNLPPR